MRISVSLGMGEKGGGRQSGIQWVPALYSHVQHQKFMYTQILRCRVFFGFCSGRAVGLSASFRGPSPVDGLPSFRCSPPAAPALALVNGLQPSKHENGFSSPKEAGGREHPAVPGLSMAGEAILPFANKEPFLAKAVAKAPQVTGEETHTHTAFGIGTPGRTSLRPSPKMYRQA